MENGLSVGRSQHDVIAAAAANRILICVAVTLLRFNGDLFGIDRWGLAELVGFMVPYLR